jgi:hypothetical protein
MAALGCRATTGRPPFPPFPEAEHVEIGFGLVDKVVTVMQVTDSLVAYLRADSIPVSTVKPFDGYLETRWFEAATLAPTDRRPLSDQIVRVRGWVDPSKPGYAKVEVETVSVPWADPSLPDRELETPVPFTHPVNVRVRAVLKRLTDKYGAPEDSAAVQPGNRPPPLQADSAPARPDSVAARPDSGAARPDSASRRDTTVTSPRRHVSTSPRRHVSTSPRLHAS